MNPSYGEIFATAKKAARGAGYAWGYAEEAAFAARWLAGHGQDGVTPLARLLARTSQGQTADWTPAVSGTWTASGGTLCPIITGAALSDRADTLQSGDLVLGQIAEPTLLLPFAASASRTVGQGIRMFWDGGEALVDETGAALENMPGETVTSLSVTLTDRRPTPASLAARADVNAQAWDRLNHFAHKTYAPATEASRLKGAGAGLTDND